MIDNSFAENIMNEIFEEPEATSVVVQEGLIKRIREILSKKRKQKETSDIAKKPDKKKDFLPVYVPCQKPAIRVYF